MTNQGTNARFWVWRHGGWVKLTLKPDQTLSWGSFHRHDEGWSSETNWWHYDPDRKVIELECFSDGADCDGRFSTQVSLECPVEDLAAKSLELADRWNPPGTPDWKRVEASQRDYTAEAMGY